ncbi:unnamed protein product [Musa acuminata var. zebrina]
MRRSAFRTRSAVGWWWPAAAEVDDKGSGSGGTTEDGARGLVSSPSPQRSCRRLVLSVILVPVGGGRNHTVLRFQDREEKLILAAPEAASYWIRYPIGKRAEDCFAAVFEIPNLSNGRRTGDPTQEEHARPEIPCPGKLDSLLAADELYSEAAHNKCMVKAPEAKDGGYRHRCDSMTC